MVAMSSGIRWFWELVESDGDDYDEGPAMISNRFDTKVFRGKHIKLTNSTVFLSPFKLVNFFLGPILN